jgi:endonuclease/exonuclease/phosphatase family metal-dependent hydrolase
MRGVGAGVVALTFLVIAGCGGPRMQLVPTVPTCRVEPSDGGTIRWIAPDDAATRRLLGSWCDTVGPAAFHRRRRPVNAGATILVTWNVHGGSGDVRGLLASLRARERAAGREDPNVVLLLQEAIRIGAAPARVPAGSPMPRRVDGERSPVPDILEVAALEDLEAVYVPSMRNGREGSDGREGVPEDRGNAILSTLPLSDVVAVELPLDRQRRVAVSARVGEGTSALRAVSVHLDTAGGQGRQAAALLDALTAIGADERLLIGGDFNSALRRDAVIRSSGLEVHRVPCRGATHKFFQLDHVLTRGFDGLTECTRLERFGSDHSPLAVTLSSRNPTDAAAPSPSTARARRSSRK